jgi:hypothetical protein
MVFGQGGRAGAIALSPVTRGHVAESVAAGNQYTEEQIAKGKQKRFRLATPKGHAQVIYFFFT